MDADVFKHQSLCSASPEWQINEFEVELGYLEWHHVLVSETDGDNFFEEYRGICILHCFVQAPAQCLLHICCLILK